MGTTPNVSISFNSREFTREVKQMTDTLKGTQKEFKLTNAELQNSGTKLDVLKNKYASLSTQLKQQSDLTSKYREAVKGAEQAQEKARQRLEKANAEYVKGKTDLKGNKEELQKLKDEVKKAEKAVSSAERSHTKWNNKLIDSKIAESNLKAELKSTSSELQKQQKYIAQVTSKYQELSTKTAGVQRGLSSAGRTLTATVTAPIIAAGAAAVKANTDFNKAVANIGTLGVSDNRLAEIKPQIQDIAIQVAKDTTDIADGVYQVVSAFGDTNDTLEITLINAKAAAAGLSTTTDAINLTSAITKGYGDTSAEAVQHASDLAFLTVKLGQTDFPQLASSMGKTVAPSKALGVSQEELFAVFATLTGVTGNASEVATQLGAVYTGLMTPTEGLKKQLKQMGYESGFAMVKSLGLKGAFDKLAQATGGSEEKLTKLFGSKEAITAMLALSGSQAEVFANKLNQLTDSAGATDDAFRAQSEGVNHAGFTFVQSMSRMRVAAQQFGESAAPFISRAADAVSGLATWLNQLTEEQRSRLMGIAVALAALGPVLSIASKGITVVNGIRSLVSGFNSVATAATEAATAAAKVGTATAEAATAAASATATAASRAGDAVATAATTAGGAVATAATTAGTATTGAASTATGAMSSVAETATVTSGAVKGIGIAVADGLGAAIAPLAIFGTALAAMYGGVWLAGKGVEKYYRNLGKFGGEAASSVQKVQGTLKEVLDVSQQIETVDEYIEKYNQLVEIRNSGEDTPEYEQERKELEQWFIANYGDYISAEERKNGIHANTINMIKQVTHALKEKKLAELEASKAESKKKIDTGAEKAPNAQKAIKESNQKNKNLQMQRDSAEKLSTELEVVKNKYDLINKTLDPKDRGKAVQALISDNENLLNSYKELTGTEFSFGDYEKSINNLKDKVAEWNKQIDGNNERIAASQKSLEEYRQAVEDAQGAIINEALVKNNFGSIGEILSSGDAEKIQKVIDTIKKSASDFGLTAQETAVEISLFKNGFKGIGEVFASGDVNAVPNTIRDIIKSCKETGASAEQTALQIALFKNGFLTFGEAVAVGDGAIKAVTKDLEDLVKLPDGKHIEITADGDIKVIDEVTQKTDYLNGKHIETLLNIEIDGIQDLEDAEENFSLFSRNASDAQGNINILNKALLELKQYGAITNGTMDKMASMMPEVAAGFADAEDKGEYLTACLNNQELIFAIAIAKAKAYKEALDKIPEDVRTKVTTEYKTVGSPPDYDALKSGQGPRQKQYPNGIVSVIENHAKGTDNARPGKHVVNDGNGAELIEHRDGTFGIAPTAPAIVTLQPGDKVYTAEQTRTMTRKEIPLQHFANGKDNKSRFELSKESFEYRRKTSEVTDLEALTWWRNVLAEYADDADAVKEANIEIYSLTKKLNDQSIQDYKKRISDQERSGKDWVEYETKMNNLSVEEQIAAYYRMGDNYRNTLNEMTANCTLSAEEQTELWNEYYQTIQDHEETIRDLQRKRLEEQNELSIKYVQERTYANDWVEYGDDPMTAYDRVKNRLQENLNVGKITPEEYQTDLNKTGKELFEGRLANSKAWLQEQRKYGNLSDQEYIDGINRIKAYTQQYYSAGMINFKTYTETMRDLNSETFDESNSLLNDYVDDYYKAQQDMLDARRKAIEEKYQMEESAETNADRTKQLTDLQEQYAKYEGAVTIEGKKKLAEIREQMEAIQKEKQREEREKRKQKELDDLNDRQDALAEEQEKTLNGLNKYTAQALGIVSGGNEKAAQEFTSLIGIVSKQQEQLAKQGYDNVSKIVDMTNQKLAQIGLGGAASGQSGSGETNISVHIQQNNHNTIRDATSARVYANNSANGIIDAFTDASAPNRV